MPGVKSYQDRIYSVLITLPLVGGVVAAGAIGAGSVTVQNFPFLCKRITHAIVGPNGLVLPVALGSYQQDGQYRIRFRTDTHNYMNEPVQAIAGFGGGQFMPFLDLSAPVEMSPKETIQFDIINDAPRGSEVTIQIVCHGVEPIEV